MYILLYVSKIINGTVVGSVRATCTDRNVCEIGRVVVDPHYRKRGIASALMKHVERVFETCDLYEIFTGDKSSDVIRLYNNLGYKVVDAKPVKHYHLVIMQKPGVKALTTVCR